MMANFFGLRDFCGNKRKMKSALTNWIWIAVLLLFMTAVCSSLEEDPDGDPDADDPDSDPEEHYPLLEDPLHPPSAPSNGDHSVPLPVFLEEPVDTYIIKNKPALLTCRAAHALQLYFKCQGKRLDGVHLEFVDPQTGVRNVETSVNVTRDAVEEFFGKFRCECVAWTSRGQVTSQPNTIVVACEYEIHHSLSATNVNFSTKHD
ncbi:netrin receptor unc-5 [Nilaparvata lugens]|uniref:netrin receptor unc-5 n=1 Tax=Nilaparvata lugens TaxID=108931 RepID=UPI00193CCABF|nr:netrin receptor unc-5 [Nilaparvata lugens]